MTETIVRPTILGVFRLIFWVRQWRPAERSPRPVGRGTLTMRPPGPGVDARRSPVTAPTTVRTGGPAPFDSGPTLARSPGLAARRPVAESPVVARWCYPTLRMRQEAFAAALEHARSFADREVIGLLVRPSDSAERLATTYVPIDGAECSATAAGVPGELLKRLCERLHTEGLAVVGFVHSHPPGSDCLHSRVDETFVREFLPSFAEHGRVLRESAGSFRVSASAVEYQLTDGRWCRYRVIGPPVAGDPEAREPRRWVAPGSPTFDVAATTRASLVTDEGERLRIDVCGTSLSFGIPRDTTLLREEYQENPGESVLFSLIVTPDGDAGAGALLLLPSPAGCERGQTLQLFGPAPLEVVDAQPTPAGRLGALALAFPRSLGPTREVRR